MNMKNVLFIIGGLHGGGAEKALVELLANFDYERYHVTLCVVYYSGIYMSQIPEPVEVIYLYGEKRGYLRDSLKRKSFRYFLKKGSTTLLRWRILYKIREKKFDAIISYIEGNALLFHNLIRHRAKKNITWVHCDLYNYHWTTNFFKLPGYEKSCYMNMDEIVFVSRNAMGAFDKLYDIDIPKHCIYNIVDVEKIRRLVSQKEVLHSVFTIIAIGSLIDVKGFDRLVRVAKMFKDNGYTLSFQILGIGDNKDSLLALCDSLGVSDCVSFLGFQNPPYPYLAAADVLVSTSVSEGLPFVICEALALGIPVVATRTAGSVELLDDGKYGVLTGHDDVSIYEGLKTLVDNQQLHDDFKLKAKERSKIFDVKQTMQKVYHLIEN
ncbi:glycosyltransferase [Bacteroides stercorirosoris]|uniref:Glycosyltransferase n=2 Tax=Bacteroides stercorirosoris TaxID=871324 RepID=A0A413HA50_9BACE|nr:glycosyltransferase [Bacteroides stercorirosoris]